MMDSKLSETVTSDASVAAASADFTKALNRVVDWKGVLTDGTFVSYFENDDFGCAALSIMLAGSDAKKTWMGAMTVVDKSDGVETTITDGTTKESIVMKWSLPDEDGAMDVDIQGYGKVTLVPLTVEDYQKAVEAVNSLNKQ